MNDLLDLTGYMAGINAERLHEIYLISMTEIINKYKSPGRKKTKSFGKDGK